MNVVKHTSASDVAARSQRVRVLIVTGPARPLCAAPSAALPSTTTLPAFPALPPLLSRHATASCQPHHPSRTLRTRTRSTQPAAAPLDPSNQPDQHQPTSVNGLTGESLDPALLDTSASASFADPAASTWDPAQQPSTAALEAAGVSVSGPEAVVRGRAPHAPRRVCVFVEPSPFTYVSGYKNRFTTMIRFLVEAGCEVMVVTTGKGYTLPGVDASSFCEQPSSFAGARVVSALSFGCPWYAQVPLSFALSPRIWREVRDFQPDLIHCTSPGVMVFAARLYAWLLKAAVVLSYHTHVPSYLPRYGISWLVPAMWRFVRLLHASAHLTLTVSPAMVEELAANRAVDRREQIQVWKKGVDSDTFHPRFRCSAMRHRLTSGRPERPVLVYVGRLGFEKNLFFLRALLDRNPGVSLAFVGDGPARGELQAAFRGTPTTFMGMLHGEDLSAAYASSDVFVMPSESETLGFVVLEAMACQLPVVAVRAGGIPDIIRPEDSGVTGFLYEPADVERAAELVGLLAADAELRARVGARARQEVAKWDWRAATLHLLNVQYPLAMAAAAAQYGRALGDVAASALAEQQQGQGGQGGQVLAPQAA